MYGSRGERNEEAKSRYKEKAPKIVSSGLSLLVHQDSNLDKQYQKLLCYHYTMDQTCCSFFQKRCKDMEIGCNLQIFLHFFLFGNNQIIVLFATLNE